MASKIPQKLVIILGSTGAGKTNLSLRIAKKFDGEIVNCDSMQLYKHLEILTNKPSKSEFESCHHHLFNVFNPNEPCNSFKFQELALPRIHQIHSRGRVPILVGGTHLYIDTILFEFLFSNNLQGLAHPLPLPPGYQDISEFESEETRKVHSMLEEVDPIQAKLIHPNNLRKNIRALSVYYLTGKRMSELIAEQKKETGADSPTGSLRFEDPCIIWLDCERKTLYERIESRVDRMIVRGLMQEIKDFYVNEYLKSPVELRSKGLFQSIGFKEWLPYLEKWHRGDDESECEKTAETCIIALKKQTRNYARSQIGWIRNRYVMKRGDRAVPRFYKLDGTSLCEWESNVGGAADEIVSAYLKGEYPKSVLPVENTPYTVNTVSYNFCQKCQLVIIGDDTFQIHFRSRKHHIKIRKLKRLQALLKNHEIRQSNKVNEEKSTDTFEKQSIDIVEKQSIDIEG